MTLGLARLLESRTTVGALVQPAATALLGLALVTFAVATPLQGVGHNLESRTLSAVGLLTLGFSGAFLAIWWLSAGADVLSGVLVLAAAATIALTGAGILTSHTAFAGWSP